MGEQLSDLTHLLLVVVPSLVVGLAVTVLVGLSVPLVVQRRLPKLPWPGDGESEPPSEDPNAGPVMLLGDLERLLFFVSFWLGWWQLVAAWLAFKLTSKWEVWHHIVRMPEDQRMSVDPPYRRDKIAWSSRLLQRWLIGVLLNIFVAMAGVAAARATQAFLEAFIVWHVPGHPY